MKSERIQIRVDAETVLRLDALADKLGLTRSAVIRMLIRSNTPDIGAANGGSDYDLPPLEINDQ